MYMYEFAQFFLYETSDKMLEEFYVFAMDTDHKSTIWCLDTDIDIISRGYNWERCYLDAKSSPELCHESQNSLFHNNQEIMIVRV